MEKKQALLGIATILGTCADLRREYYIEGYVYAGLVGSFSLEEFKYLLRFLKEIEAIENWGEHTFAVTAKGYAMGEEMNRAMKEVQ